MKKSSPRRTSSRLTKGGSLPTSVTQILNVIVSEALALQGLSPAKNSEDQIDVQVGGGSGNGHGPIDPSRPRAASHRQTTKSTRSHIAKPRNIDRHFGPSNRAERSADDLGVARNKSMMPTITPALPAAGAIPGWKRALDLTLVALASPLWLPLMILVMIFIRLTSAGPVFFRQERIGYRRKRFMIYKFRSMKVNADTAPHEGYFERLMKTDVPMVKLDRADERIIRGGRLLRATGLDELPQIFNVIRGDMSLVGPRPCTVREFERYLPWQQERVAAPPGLTGYWQVNGKNRTTFNEMIEMDIFYTKRMSLRFDLLILWRTVPAIWHQTSDLVRDRLGPAPPPRKFSGERRMARVSQVS